MACIQDSGTMIMIIIIAKMETRYSFPMWVKPAVSWKVKPFQGTWKGEVAGSMGPFYWKKNSKQKFPLFDLIPPSMLLLPTITIWQAPAHLKKFSILIVYIPFCLATEATIMLCIFYVPIPLCLLYALTFPFFDLPYFNPNFLLEWFCTLGFSPEK